MSEHELDSSLPKLQPGEYIKIGFKFIIDVTARTKGSVIENFERHVSNQLRLGEKYKGTYLKIDMSAENKLNPSIVSGYLEAYAPAEGFSLISNSDAKSYWVTKVHKDFLAPEAFLNKRYNPMLQYLSVETYTQEK